MKRRIVFRIWDRQKNKFYEPVYKAYEGEIEELLLDRSGELCMRTFSRMDHESVFPDRFEIMQYTGLKDRNGKEIYEGDIVLVILTGDYFEVIWDSIGGMFLFSNTNPEKAKNGAIDYYDLEDEMSNLGSDVVGNIYENPELLVVQS